MTLPLTLAEALKRYGVDLVSHPESRSIDDIETAGCLMLEAKRRIEKLEAENEALQAEKQEKQELTDEQIDSACLSYRHDFGLLSVVGQDYIRFQAKEWAAVLAKVRGNKH
jgi:hypothetical protein